MVDTVYLGKGPEDSQKIGSRTTGGRPDTYDSTRGRYKQLTLEGFPVPRDLDTISGEQLRIEYGDPNQLRLFKEDSE